MGAAANQPRWINRTAIVLGLLAAANTLAIVLVYAFYPGYLDTNEAGLVAMTRLMLLGEPVYHSLQSADRLSHLHGPLTFLWTALPQLTHIDSVAVGRLSATLAALLLPAVMVLTYHRRGLWAASIALALGSLAVVLHLNMSIIVRPDMPMAVLVALAVWVVAWGDGRRDMIAGVLLGLCIGLVAGFKFTAVVTLAPLALYYCAGDWRRRLLPVGLSTIVVAAAPFATPAFSFSDYMDIVASATGKENAWRGFIMLWWKFAIYLSVPSVMWMLAGRQARAALHGRAGLYLASYVLACLITLYPATKIGAGHYYYLPFMPLMVDLAFRALDAGEAKLRQRVALTAVVALCVAAAWQHSRRFYKSLDWAETREVTAEIQEILATYRGKTIQMGIGGVTEGDALNYRFYAFRDLLVMAGQPYTMDVNVVMEMTKLRIPEPPAFIERLKACHTNLWLVPRSETPFSLWGYYYQTVFSTAYRETFAATHTLIASHKYFDIWECRGAP